LNIPPLGEEDTDFDNLLKNFMMPKSVSMDGGAPQLGPAQLQGQFENSVNWEQGAYSVRVFELDIEDDSKAYAELLTTAAKQDPSVVIVEQEKQFCKASENWKVLVTSVEIVYKQSVNNPKKK
jgi:hypothetical protein